MLKSSSYELKFTSCEFKFTSYEFESTSSEFKFTSFEFKSKGYEFKPTSWTIIKSVKTHVRQLVPSVSGDNLFFNGSSISWLWLQQEAKWININLERRDLDSLQKCHPSPMILEKFPFFFAFYWRKQNLIDYSFISLTLLRWAFLGVLTNRRGGGGGKMVPPP